jgi:hypothetical protein
MLLGIVATAAAVVCASTAWAQRRQAVDPRWLDRGQAPQLRMHQLERLVGHLPPPFTDDLRWLDGEPAAWGDLRGRVVVVQSWNLGTQEGRNWLARMEQLRRIHPEEDVAILAVHTPPGEESLSSYLARSSARVKVVADPTGEFCDRMGFYERPSNIVVGRNGVVRLAGLNFRGVRELVELLVEERFDPEDAEPLRMAPDPEGLEYPPPDPLIRIRGKDVRGQEAPSLDVQRWLGGEAPEVGDRSLLLAFFATWSPPSERALPVLNALATGRSEELAVVAISNEHPLVLERYFAERERAFSVGIDRRNEMAGSLELRALPHAIVVSPDGIVRWQGDPMELREAVLDRILAAASGDPAVQGGFDRPRWVEPEAAPVAERTDDGVEGEGAPDGG